MAVRIVTHQALIQPKDIPNAQKISEIFGNFLLREMRVAIRIEQAGFGGDECASTVDLEGSAFQHDPRREKLQVPESGDVLRNQVVQIKSRILPAPGVVLPINDGPLAFAMAFTNQKS